MLPYAKISRYKVERIFSCFFDDFTATQTSKILAVNRNTINLWYNRFREAIVRVSIEESKHFKEKYELESEFELDESYF
jgi:transposase-like protein